MPIPGDLIDAVRTLGREDAVNVLLSGVSLYRILQLEAGGASVGDRPGLRGSSIAGPDSSGSNVSR